MRLDLSPEQRALLEAHFALLLRWNNTLNLTRIEEHGEAMERHYGESLFLASHLPTGALRIADIGSGGGFPGFPVAVVRSECQVALIEGHQRKAVFLKEASRKVPNIRVLAKRAEDVRERFDIVISRAVSYSDLEAPMKALAPVAYLLTGAEAPLWPAETIPLPGSKQRFLRIVRFT